MGRNNRNTGAYKNSLKEAIAQRDGLFCGICRRVVMSSDDMTIDHITPLSEGGDSSFKNLQIAHEKCNSRKGGKK